VPAVRPRFCFDPGVVVLDAVFLAATVALFALVALVAKGVEKLGPEARASSSRATDPAASAARRNGGERS
jgi:hypothetical protein